MDDPDEVAHNYATVLATLSAIGGVDERPRLGGLVQHADWATCTIARIAANGKITVQPHDYGPMKSCRLVELTVVRSAICDIHIIYVVEVTSIIDVCVCVNVILYPQLIIVCEGCGREV